MNWLLSRSCQVAPPSLERYSAESFDSMNAYTIFESDGAIATSIRPQGARGSPLAPSANRLQVRPPSVVRYSALPLGASSEAPPERKVQPLRRKSHSPANSTSGAFGSMARLEHPVDRLGPLSTRLQVLPA